MPVCGLAADADQLAVGQDLEPADGGFLGLVKLPSKGGQHLLLFLAEGDIADRLRCMTDLRILGLLLLHFEFKPGRGQLLHSQGRAIAPCGCLHVGQEQRRGCIGAWEGGGRPDLGYRLVSGGNPVLHGPEAALARFPGYVIDCFVDVFVDIQFLLAEVVGKAGGGDILEPAADGVGLVVGGDSGHHHRCFGKGCAEGNRGPLGCACKAARLDHGTVRQGVPPFFHHHIGDRFFRMGAVEIIPLAELDVKAGGIDIAQANDAWIRVIKTCRTGNDNRILEGGAQRYPDPVAGDGHLAGFDIETGGGLFRLDRDRGRGGGRGPQVVGDLEGGCKTCLGGVGMGDRLAAGGTAVAEMPGIGGNGAVAV